MQFRSVREKTLLQLTNENHTVTHSRVPQRGVMLKHHQVETLVAAMAIEAQSASEPAAPSTSVVSDITLPLMEAAPSVGHEKQQPEKTHDGDSLTEEGNSY